MKKYKEWLRKQILEIETRYPDPTKLTVGRHMLEYYKQELAHPGSSSMVKSGLMPEYDYYVHGKPMKQFSLLSPKGKM